MRQLLMIFFLLTGLAGLGQNVVWEWAKQLSNPYSAYCHSMAVDISCNVYLTGFSGSPLISDSILIYPHYYFAAGFRSNGSVNWLKSITGPGSGEGRAICCDNSGNIFVSGEFGDTTVFGNDTLACYQGLFLTKYDSEGQVIKVSCIEDSGGHGIYSAATDNSGNVFICGYFNSHDFNFGDTIIHNAQTGGSGSMDAFVAKFDSTGNFLWVRSIGGPYGEIANFISNDSFGNIYLSGYFTSASITLDTIVLTNQGNYDVFLVKYDEEGNVKWAKSFGGTSTENVNSLITDNFGNVYISSSYLSANINIDGQILNNPGNGTSFIAKYDSDGNIQWAKNVGEGGTVDNVKLTSDGINQIFVCGTRNSPTLSIGDSILSGTKYCFIARMDSDGNYSWVINDFYSCWMIRNISYYNNSLVVSGNFEGTLVFGTDTLVNTNTPGFGFTDIFLAKLHIEPVGFEEVLLSGTLQVYPNPAAGQFNVVVSGCTSLLRVYDGMGRLLQQYQNPAQGELSIRVSNPGLCLVQAFSQNGVLNARVVVR
jgi:hypothetical protein